VDPAANIQPLGLYPEDWDVLYNPGDPSIAWVPDEFSSYLPPGSTSTFSFLSELPPVQQDYVLFGLDDSGQNDGMVTGQVIGPGSVPEPKGTTELESGAIAIGCFAIFRQQRKARASKGSVNTC
jgi:hypothetical protein